MITPEQKKYTDLRLKTNVIMFATDLQVAVAWCEVRPHQAYLQKKNKDPPTQLVGFWRWVVSSSWAPT